MATGNRTLKLSILADVDDLKKKLGEADKSVEANSKKISDFGKRPHWLLLPLVQQLSYLVRKQLMLESA
jgi:hypothetical protein